MVLSSMISPSITDITLAIQALGRSLTQSRATPVDVAKFRADLDAIQVELEDIAPTRIQRIFRGFRVRRYRLMLHDNGTQADTTIHRLVIKKRVTTAPLSEISPAALSAPTFGPYFSQDMELSSKPTTIICPSPAQIPSLRLVRNSELEPCEPWIVMALPPPAAPPWQKTAFGMACIFVFDPGIVIFQPRGRGCFEGRWNVANII